MTPQGLSSTTSVGAVVGYLHLDTTGYDKSMTEATARLGIFSKQFNTGLRNIGASFSYLGRRAMMMGTVITGLGVAAVKTFGTFERAMHEATAVSDTTTAQFTLMSQMAEVASIKFNKSATETAQAFYFLGSAGLTAAEQIESFYQVVAFARAGVMDTGRAAEITVDTMKGFGKSFSEVMDILDVLTMAFISSNTNLAQLGESMSLVAAIARDTRTPIEQVAAALGLMADVGIKGSRAGTALRRAFVNMMDPSDEMRDVLRMWNIELRDAERNMKPFVQIVDEMSTSLANATGEQREHAFATLFGVRALTGQLAVFRDNGAHIKDFVARLNDASGSLEKVVEKQMTAMLNKVGALGRRFATLSRHIGGTLAPDVLKLTEALNPLIEHFITWVDLNNELVGSISKNVLIIGVLTTAVGGLTLGLGSLAWAASYLLPVLATLGKALVVLIPLALAIAAVGAALYTLRAQWNVHMGSMAETAELFAQVITSGWRKMADDIETIFNGIKFVWKLIIWSLKHTWNEWLYEFAQGVTRAQSLANKILPEGQHITGAETFERSMFDKWAYTQVNRPRLWQEQEENARAKVERAAKTSVSSGSPLMAQLKKAGGIMAKSFKDSMGDDLKAFFQPVADQFGKDISTIKAAMAEHFPGLVKGMQTFAMPTGLPFTGGINPTAGGGSRSPFNRGGSSNAFDPSKLSVLGRGLHSYETDMRAQFKDLASFATEAMVQAASDIEGAFTDGFANIMKSGGDLEESLVSFAKSIQNAFFDMIAQIIARWVMMKAIGGFFPGAFPMGNQTGGAPVSQTAAVAHNGLPIDYIPRLHNGLAAGEFPAILEKGEEVIPKKTPRVTEVNNQINIINQSSNAVKAQTRERRISAEQVITEVLLRDATNNGPLSSAGVIKQS